ncbi:MAG TPA: asparaginase [Gemmatimonadales bacterium]|nr:asparaginase [Gemmatimonadales bacterium]
MDTPALRVEVTRGDLVESVHQVTAAVVASDGPLLAAAGDPTRETWWRSAAKPFQALPLIQDGVAERFGLGEEDLAFACASNSSEVKHREAARRFMDKVGVTEAQLSCGIHIPLSPVVAHEVACGAATMTPLWSNCAGKHIGMLALARHHGWPLEGYHVAGHPVQQRILVEIARWSGVAGHDLRQGVDGCTVVCFALPVEAMARAYSRLASAEDPALRRVAGAMMRHPMLVGGTGRLCTELMEALPGRILVKLGAEGVFCAAIPELGVGVALKVIDGDTRASGLALLEVLQQVFDRLAPSRSLLVPAPIRAKHGPEPIVNTRNAVTGEMRVTGSLRFFDA